MGDPTLLHGRLVIHIREAEGLPDADSFLFDICRGDLTDAYVTCSLGTARLCKTKVVDNSLQPQWHESFNIYVCHWAQHLTLNVMDKDITSYTSESLGVVNFETSQIASEELIDDWFDVTNGDGESLGKINVAIQYTSRDSLLEEMYEMENSYFPMRTGCRLIMYQDADTPPLPQFDGVTNSDGSQYTPTRAWKDLYDCLNAAQKFIYITGWSVFTQIKLLRGEDDADETTVSIGDLLKAKALLGVRVLVMVWNEKLSTDFSAGMMGTHDEETLDFFQDSEVRCVLTSRSKSDFLSDQFVSTCYTHHQKTVICDAEMDESQFKVIAFIGGLDITDGRYDTPEFPLFRTIKTLHKEDFYNNCIVGVTADTGPRQPWHDIHAKVEGPIALDIKANFEERWQKQAEEMKDDLFVLDEDFVDPEEEGSWSLQLFRSINADSCIFQREEACRLHSKGGRQVETSIQDCMVRQIRNAQNFIYMENQYFLGSAFTWKEDNDTLAHHLIPHELTQRIIGKIYREEPFKCYIVLPMFPEGDPSSAAIQEILYWQHKTLEGMYSQIAQAIKEMGSESHPTDYLSFFCLAKRESPDEACLEELAEPEPETAVAVVRQMLRHQVYVHSKMSIFDDAYILIGSANINQRSLSGNRDTEIAVGGYQPDNIATGDVHTFRKALWAAHFGGYNEAFQSPQSEECLAAVREVTNNFWDLYTDEEPAHSDVHALPYPIEVDEDGNVSAKPENGCFPDTVAPILGAKSWYLHGKLTT